MNAKTALITAMAKHLPPSASALNLLDVGGETGTILASLRSDVVVIPASLAANTWQFAPDSMDALTLYDMLPDAALLAAGLRVLRPGGRLIIVNPASHFDEKYGHQLETAGYTRILVEPALDDSGVLIRGEKPHTTLDTLARVHIVADRDADATPLSAYNGRFVHLLIQQTPNKPVWKLAPDEKITWHAAAVVVENETHLLAFTSLPKAVSLMQPAVVQGIIRDVNKVAKFSKATAQTWAMPVLLNPTLDQLRHNPILFVPIDPASAEVSDE
jgi:SAM-dependent methyltransferase